MFVFSLKSLWSYGRTGGSGVVSLLLLIIRSLIYTLMSRKITLIGAGSVVFAKTLISDILQFPELADSTICLMDIDPDRLKVAEIMMSRIATKLGGRAKVEATLNQRDAVRGAHYVICTVQVGGYKPSTVRDFEIPKKYGLEQTIADTLGVGGVFRGLRTIPVLLGIARDIADVGAANCLLLNYTNPMCMNCWAIDRATGISHVGLCHSVFGTARMLARHAGLPFEDVSYLVAGINHMAFFLKFQYRGQDAYPLLFKVLEDPNRQFEKVRYEMMRRTGYFVTESSEHQSEYLPYFIHHGKKVIEEFDIPLDEYIRRCEAIIGTWGETEAKLLGKGDDIEIPAQSHEYGSYIIHSRETDTLRTVYANVPNRGIIENLPDGCNIEVPCMVDATGIRPVHIGNLPPQLAALCQTNINVQQLTVEAALSGKREHIYHAVMLDPHAGATLRLDQIWKMCDELIEVHQKDGYLSEFAPVVNNTGRSYKGTGDRVIARLEMTGHVETRQGGRNALLLKLDNRDSKPRKVKVRIEPREAGLKVEGKRERRFQLKPGQQLEEAVRLVCLEPITGPVKVDLYSDDPDCLTIGGTLTPRRQLEADEDGKCHFDLQLGGFPAAEGWTRREKDGLRLYLKVMDSDIKPGLANKPLSGSFVRLEFMPGTAGSDILPIVIKPAGKARSPEAITFKGKRLSTARIKQRKTPLYYTLDVFLPRALLGIPTMQDALLFHLTVQLGALGDAHSGGWASVSGSSESHGDYSRFLEI